MSDLNEFSRDEILNLIKEDADDFFECFFETLELGSDEIEDAFSSYGKKPTLNGFTLKLVHEVGGGEGEGETVERVYAVIEVGAEDNHLAYCQLDGFYTSNYGTEWEDMPYVVFPREVMVTKYFREGE